ncbi:hypothetical protein [Actinoplanes italicus]|uniref:hypothetical protein n=1 Tax=Actinoplanes italicus TaxID=113567 RepID=UPI0011B286D7|nr:hypothetical protein [Actinoplanes italicus]
MPDGLRAVVIDTNSTVHGRIDLNALRSLAEALARKAPETEIWLPEPVIWEWATHAQEDYDELAAANNAVVRKLNAARITPSFAKVKDQDRVDVYDAVTQEIEGLCCGVRSGHAFGLARPPGQIALASSANAAPSRSRVGVSVAIS